MRSVVVGVLVLYSFLVACGDETPYRIGVVLDRDGLRGATSAVQRVNATGGIRGHRLELRDVGGAGSTKAALALATAERLTADPTIVAVVGHTNSSASLAASQVYNARHVVQIAPTSSAPLYSQAGPYSFRLVGSDLHQGIFLANDVLARYPRSRIAVMFVNDDYGRPLRGVFVERLRAGGVTPVYDSPYGEADFAVAGAEMVATLSGAKPDLLIWIGRAPEFIAVNAQLKQALPRLAVLASDGFSGSSVSNDTLHTLDGVSYVRLLDSRRTSPELEQLRADYKRKQWVEPGDQDILSYDAVMLLADAMRNVGAHREAIRDWLSRVGHDLPPVQALSGPIAFASGGDRRPQYFIEEIGKARLDSARD